MHVLWLGFICAVDGPIRMHFLCRGDVWHCHGLVYINKLPGMRRRAVFDLTWEYELRRVCGRNVW